jgi:DNA-binding NarL/FixJ family response regulator
MINLKSSKPCTESQRQQQELEIVKYVVLGFTAKQIAAVMGLNINTVKKRRKSVGKQLSMVIDL